MRIRISQPSPPCLRLPPPRPWPRRPETSHASSSPSRARTSGARDSGRSPTSRCRTRPSWTPSTSTEASSPTSGPAFPAPTSRREPGHHRRLPASRPRLRRLLPDREHSGESAQPGGVPQHPGAGQIRRRGGIRGRSELPDWRAARFISPFVRANAGVPVREPELDPGAGWSNEGVLLTIYEDEKRESVTTRVRPWRRGVDAISRGYHLRWEVRDNIVGHRRRHRPRPRAADRAAARDGVQAHVQRAHRLDVILERDRGRRY